MRLGATFMVLCCLTAIFPGCDRERDRARNEVEASGTRAVHARDRVENRVEETAWRPDVGVADARDEALEPVGATGLELGDPVIVASEDGMTLERQKWAFQGIHGVAHRVRVPRRRAVLNVRPSDHVVPLAELTTDSEKPYAAINGGFYDTDDVAMGLVVSDGEEFSAFRKGGGSGIVSSHDGEVRITHRSDWKGGADEALQSIDRIVSGGESLMTEGRRERHTARSGIAIGHDYVWLVVLFEDESAVVSPAATQLRSTSFRGVPLWAFARYLIETTDAQEALNLDGAVSTQLRARVGEESLEIRGERGTINALILTTR